MTEVDVLGLLEVKESDLVLQVADLVANRNLVGDGKDAVLKRFVEDGDFSKHFWFIHKYNVAKFSVKVKKFF